MDRKFIALETEDGVWTVGRYDRDGRFDPETDHESRDEAQRVAAEMNHEEIYARCE